MYLQFSWSKKVVLIFLLLDLREDLKKDINQTKNK